MVQKQRCKRRHEGRDDLTGEHTIGDGGQIILAVLFAIVWVLDTFFLKATTDLNGCIPLGIRMPFGIVLLVLSGYLARAGMSVVFGEKREMPAVIKKGVFGVVRHPIYLSEILLYLGFCLISVSLAALCVVCVAVLFLYLISRYEEKLLLARFGESYKEYMQEVGMWIPRFGKR